jgi:hypothetical protein
MRQSNHRMMSATLISRLRWTILKDPAVSMSTLPKVTTSSQADGAVTILVTNSGPSVVYYRALVTGEMQLFQETFVDGKWRMTSWDWMFDSERTAAYEILPTQQATLNVRFWDDGCRERMLALFYESGTDRRSLVVLAEEP